MVTSLGSEQWSSEFDLRPGTSECDHHTLLRGGTMVMTMLGGIGHRKFTIAFIFYLFSAFLTSVSTIFNEKQNISIFTWCQKYSYILVYIQRRVCPLISQSSQKVGTCSFIMAKHKSYLSFLVHFYFKLSILSTLLAFCKDKQYLESSNLYANQGHQS